MGAAKAEANRLEGMTEVEIIREKGKAEAEAMLKRQRHINYIMMLQ